MPATTAQNAPVAILGAAVLGTVRADGAIVSRPTAAEALYAEFEADFLALTAAPWLLPFADEPLTPPQWDECGRCGGEGHETRLEGDREYSLGPCWACDGRREVEVESFPVDFGAAAPVIPAEA